jgi:hypothetical protein
MQEYEKASGLRRLDVGGESDVEEEMMRGCWTLRKSGEAQEQDAERS